MPGIGRKFFYHICRMFSVNLHEIIDRSVLAIFDHEHLWLHIVGHVVLVVMPVVLLFLLIRWLIQLIPWLASVRPIKLSSTNFDHNPVLPKSIMGFIFRYSGRSQLVMSILALSILPVTYAQLELPKRIINGAISTNTSSAGGLQFTSSLEQVDYLLLLCAFFLAALITSGCLKYMLNLRMGRTAERLLRHLRLHIVRKRISRSGASSEAAIVPVLTQEVEPVCSFSGDSVIVPLLHGGTVVTIITFMMVQNIILGAAAITLLPIQLIFIPRLQRRINHHVRIRVEVVRELSGDLQADENAYSRTLIREKFRSLYGSRLNIFKLKFLMKSLNNFVMNLTPFFFYTIGGYLVLEQQLSLGALVASLASYKDLAPSIRELFKYYQNIEDARIRYSGIQEYLLPALLVGPGNKILNTRSNR